MSSPRTSIIMPVYNTADTVVAAMESVLAQTDPDFERWWRSLDGQGSGGGR